MPEMPHLHPERRRLLETGTSIGRGHFAAPATRKRRLPGDQLNPSRVPIGTEHQADIPNLDFEVRDRGDEKLSIIVIPLRELLSLPCPKRRRDLETSSGCSSTQLRSESERSSQVSTKPSGTRDAQQMQLRADQQTEGRRDGVESSWERE